MRRSFWAVLLAGTVLFVLVAGTAAADGKSVAVPKGTKVEKLGPGSFKLTTPDGTVFAVTSYKRPGRVKGAPSGAAAIIGDCGILGDCGIRDAKGKIIATGANGVLKGRAATAQEVKGAPPEDYIKIDDEVTWLPAVIEFPELRIFNRTALNKLSPQPDPPGKR
jgi:hypothetical protein